MKMKKYIAVLLTLIMVLSATCTAFADGGIKVSTLGRAVAVNGVNVSSYCKSFPYFEYASTIYAPVTEENCRIMGLSIVTQDPNAIVLKEITPNQSAYLASDTSEPSKEITVNLSRKSVTIRKSSISGGRDSVVLTGEMTDGKPILQYNGAVYIPLTAKVMTNVLKWGQIYDVNGGEYTGKTVAKKPVTINSNPSVSAGIAAATSNAGGEGTGSSAVTAVSAKSLTEYIMNCNHSYNETTANELLNIIHKKSAVYGVDEKLIIAIMQVESNFKSDAVSKAGAIGMMQIMPSTAAGYGLSKEDLYDVDKNIGFGTRYIKLLLKKYDDVEKALVAYNEGGASVQNGKTSSGYSQLVLSKYVAICEVAKGN